MKHKLLLAFLGASFALTAQNWSPISIGDTLHFRHPDSSLISHSIWIDSLAIAGQDSLFFLNKALQKCPECPASGPAKAWLRNRGQFLQDFIRKAPDGKYVFEGEKKQVLMSLAPVGANWVFDTASNINATILSAQEILVFGLPDSVKTIALSNGLIIQLSKSFGLRAFPEDDVDVMELVGIAGRGLGAALPNYRDMVDFQVNDVFQYTERNSYAASVTTFERLLKYSILSRADYGDTIEYAIRRNIRTLPTINGVTYPPQFRTDTMLVWYSPDSLQWLNYTPLQLFEMLDVGPLKIYGPVRYVDLPTFGPSKIVGASFKIDGIYAGTLTPIPDESSDTMRLLTTVFGIEQRFAAGVGETFYFHIRSGLVEDRKQIGFVKNGDTTGIIYPDFQTTDTSAPQSPEIQAFRILGNPVNGNLVLEIGMSPGENGLLEIVASNGQLVYQERVSQPDLQKIIPLEGISLGTYVVRFRVGDRFLSRKFVYLMR